ncbi:ABC transporter ATP-binding protein [Luteococcus sp. Sow4_B9]|uniref:ABC transporter ATP-binding protein n=1 Tax=Luteococcus sp. Sow4_B9 TaxID=3438792 RepID=UPI003F9447AF
MSTDPLYRLRGVTRQYGRGSSTVRAVQDVGLDLMPGDRLGIVGESGSGKSTLIRMMAALDRPTDGTIEFRGTQIQSLPERSLGDLRASVQLVFQDPRSSLNPRMRVGEIITEPLRSPLLRQRDDIPVDHGKRLAEVMEQVGLSAAQADRYPHEFSGGQRQRIAIARALAPKPEVLIADEPVSALDVSVRAHVLNLLHELVEEYALTMVFVSHDLMVVRHVCDQVLVMRQGEVVERGSCAKVYQEPSHPYTQDLLAAVPRIRLQS